MDHLTADYGDTGIAVDFVKVDDEDLPKTKAAFHDFPQRKGWKVEQDYKLEPDGTSKTTRFDVFLQAWLFFGLIFTVVQDDNQPILKFDDLHDNQFLDTKKLRDALKQWAEWEQSHPNKIWLRMIQVEFVLDKARQVVRRNCGYSISSDHAEYSVQPISHSRHLTDEKALALMTVGELLSAVKSKIMQDCKAHLRGWHGDDDRGWGPPRYVFKKMEEDCWCPRAIHLLKGQLRSNATMLLEAYYAYRNTKRMTNGHADCTETDCKAKATDDQGNYTHHHMPGCDQSDCRQEGPKMQEVLKVLERSTDGRTNGKYWIPLLKFSQDDLNSVEFEVSAFVDQKFAAISHVWADGWGNDKSNTLPTCHLRFIRRQLRRVNEGRDVLFWMDTLVVPVKDETDQDKTVKKRAIGQIFDVFQNASFTVVLDNGLCDTTQGHKTMSAQTAMKILASGWMRRLWTLQEAFLSKSLFIPFRELGEMHDNITNLDDLVENLRAPKDALTSSSLAGTLCDQLLQNIMGHERDNRDFYLYKKGNRPKMPIETAATLVANAWRAARWRVIMFPINIAKVNMADGYVTKTTSNPAHETLALATLLDLSYEGTRIEEAGLAKDVKDDEIDELVKAFWETFHGKYEGAIPPGIIFLPGQKVDIRGFGWAPKTWMSGHEVDYPDPLRKWTNATRLHQGGLLVKYPGFLLHTPSDRIRRRILGTDNVNETFQFPSDRKLLEWYNVKPADPQHSVKYLNEIINTTEQLAIILSRPRPGDSPPEIGLLVGIHKENEKTGQREEVKTEFECYIIRRLHVWRETSSNYLSGPGRMGRDQSTGNKEPDEKEKLGNTPHWNVIEAEPTDDTCIGEAVGVDQTWIVDGYIPKRNKLGKAKATISLPEEPNESIIPSESDSPLMKGWFKRRTTWSIQSMSKKNGKTLHSRSTFPRDSTS